MLNNAKKTSIKLAKKYRNALLYGVIGISGVIIDFIIYVLLVKIGVPAIIASTISVSAGIINNFMWNAHYNFKTTDHIIRRFLVFYAVGATGIVLSALTIFILHNIIGIDPLVSKAVSIPFIVTFQYFFNKNSSLAKDHKSIPWRQLLLLSIVLVSYLIFIFNAPYFNFADEADNLLGGQFIADNKGALYLDYFSHHMPLVYFFAAILFKVIGVKLVAIKVVFSIIMCSWLLAMSRHLLKKFNIQTFAIFVILISITQTLSWSHMMLAETFVAFSIAHALILLITHDKRNIQIFRELIVFAILGCIPVLSAMSYAPLSIIIYAIGIVILYKNKDKFKKRHFFYAPILASLPYLALAIYLIINNTLSEFIFQSIKFNTLYYSQFLQSTPTSSLDAIFTTIHGSLIGIQKALCLNQGVIFQPISFIFTVSVIASIFIVFSKKKYLIGSFFIVTLFFGSSREGFYNILHDGGAGVRSGMIILFIGLLLYSYALFIYKEEENKLTIKEIFPYLIYITIFIISLSSIQKMSDIGKGYLAKKDIVSVSNTPESSLRIINLINKPNDTYWIGPLDFASQLKIKTKNASIYRFYLPWQAACPTCQERLLADINTNKPKVVNFMGETDIWGTKARNYASSLINLLVRDYYRIDDERLKDFYFLKTDSNRINSILSREGYKI